MSRDPDDIHRSGIPSLHGLREIERLRERLASILWAVESERYQLQGLRMFVRQQAADGLDLLDDPSEQAATELGEKRRLRLVIDQAPTPSPKAKKTAKRRYTTPKLNGARAGVAH